jgi:hypothetical protein
MLDKCSNCGRFPGSGIKCKKDSLKRMVIHSDSSKCLNSV